MRSERDIELQLRTTQVYDAAIPRSHTRSNTGSDHVQAVEDDRNLKRLGKKPVLRRTFGFMSVLGFSCTVLITWEGIPTVLGPSLENGGPAGVIWSFLICWLGMFSTFVAIGELSSMAPTAGGQYHWVSLLAPASSRKFFTYTTGWVTVLGWQALIASICFVCGTLIQGLVGLQNPDYEGKAWQNMLMYWSVAAFAVFFNTVTSRALARFEGVILFVHLFGFFAVFVPLVYFGPHGDASTFTRLRNGGGWETPGLSFVVGLPATSYCLFGADSAVHMAEEIQNAAIAVPQALVITLFVNGLLGFAMAVGMMICVGDVEAAVAAGKTLGYSFLEIFFQAVQSRTGAVLMVVLITIMNICATVGVYATASRILWSFARDQGTPFSKFLTTINQRNNTPLNAIATTASISMLLSLIVLGSSVAFNDLVTLSVSGLAASYSLACGLLLWRRCTNAIRPRDDNATVTGPDSLHWGPWHVREPFGTLNNAFAVCYQIFLLFWSFWPPDRRVQPATMNFSSLIFGSVVFFSVLWYVIRAKGRFLGPVIETDLN